MKRGNDSTANDRNTNIEDLKIRIKSFLKKREWEKYHTPKNISESICIEAAELLQIFQWMNEDDLQKFNYSKISIRVAEELADVIIYCLSMANTMKIDVANAILTKLEINERKYPVKIWKGKAHLTENNYSKSYDPKTGKSDS